MSEQPVSFEGFKNVPLYELFVGRILVAFKRMPEEPESQI